MCTFYSAIQNGKVDINEKNKFGDTLLHIACWRGDIEVVKFLLAQYDIDINTKNKENITPLHIACDTNNLKLAKVLLKNKKININAVAKRHLTPFNLILLKFERSRKRNINAEKIAFLLLSRKDIDVNIGNDCGITPLHYACHVGRYGNVRLLLDFANVDISIRNSKNETPKMYAKRLGYKKIVKLFNEYERKNSIHKKRKFTSSLLENKRDNSQQSVIDTL